MLYENCFNKFCYWQDIFVTVSGWVNPHYLIKAALGNDTTKEEVADLVVDFFDKHYPGYPSDKVRDELTSHLVLWGLNAIVSKNIRVDVYSVESQQLEVEKCIEINSRQVLQLINNFSSSA